MLLATRCPFCETVFRIQPAQLAARHGLVRCGHCREAFDASGSLFEVPEGGDFASAVPVAADVAAGLTTPPPATVDLDTPAAAASGTATPNFKNRAWDPWAPPPDSDIDEGLRYSVGHLPPSSLVPGVKPNVAPAAAAQPHLAPGAATTPSPLPEPTPAPQWRSVEPDLTEPILSANEASAARIDDHEPTLSRSAAISEGSEATVASPAFVALDPADGAEPFAVTREAPARAPRRTGRRIVGALFAIVLLALLGVQLAWWQRETVMVYWPDSQPLYVQACQQLGCRVLPPRDIDGLQVEPSDLRQVDDPHHLELKVPLRNHFNVALAYPAIELTLLDRQNNVVVRRVLWPQDYVTPGMRIEAGLPARTTQTMIVRLDTGNVVASNFRIEIFYP